MKVAEVLSDLTSLRVCGPAEALALVRASSLSSSAQSSQDASLSTSTTANSITEKREMRPGVEQDDPDLRKVYDLMHLHELVKMGYAESNDSDLEKAREKVDRVIMMLREGGKIKASNLVEY